MIRTFMTVASLAALVACGDGNPFTEDADDSSDDTTAPVEDTDIPADIQNDLGTFSFDPVAGTLTVSGITLDQQELAGTYTRTPALDVPGYTAFITQDDPLDRHVTAYVAVSADPGESVRGALVVSGGQFNTYFGGTTYSRDGAYDPPDLSPTTGLVSYAGNYVGLLNGPGDGGTLLAPPGGTDPALLPSDAAEVTGEIFLNADFADNSINGAIFNREVADTSFALDDLALRPADITSEGTFTGTVELDGVVGDSKGTYAGVFGGPDAAAVAGGIFITDFEDTFTNEEERGLFVLVQCNTPGATAPICAAVN